ncbi:MAG TPA: DegT/DnrJ/EryC1/StrS family aminotransferase [Candidatus Limnocylindria bacterium]|nr:DegT/DnrJ/EryC1/StrS family aminotransferase [Candidatus Limnocylindria bacterium]
MSRDSSWPRIPLAQPNIGSDEVELVMQVLASDVLSLGPMVEEFEALLRQRVGRKHAVACNSGTSGLHLAIRGLGIGEGTEVLTTPFSFVASANCVLYERARPRFVDIEEQTLGMDPALVEEAGTSATRAILPVHVFGNPCQIEELEAISTQRGWGMIEDACEAIGSSINGRPLGSFGNASVFAFYPNKQITTGEGGIVVTDDPELADVMASMRNQGRDEDGTWLRHVRLGFNYRLDELSAALGVAQLRRIAVLREGRDRAVRAYRERLSSYEWLSLPTPRTGADVDWFVYVVRLSATLDRDHIINELEASGIPARPYFSPLHLQPFYRSEFGYRPGDYPVTERVARTTLALPFSSLISDAQIDRVCSELVRVVSEARVMTSPQ